jgi:TolC family type I secretion outer membrane protein
MKSNEEEVMHRSYFARGGLLCVMCLAGAGYAALPAQETPETGGLTLIESIDRALEEYPSVGAAKAGVDQAGASVGEALSSWLPSLNFGATATEYSDPMPVYPIHGFTLSSIPPFNDRTGQYGITLGYTLFDGGRFANVRLARERKESAHATFEESRQNLIAQVVGSYLDVLSAREVLAAHEHRVTALESEMSRVTQFFQQERAARIEVLRAEASLASAQADYVQAREGLSVALRELALLIGDDQEEASALAPFKVTLVDTWTPDRDDILTKALLANPAVRRAKSNSAAARAGFAVARSARFPRLDLAGNYFNMGDFVGNRVNEWNAEAMLSFPLFTGGMVSKRIAGAKAAEQGAEEELRLAEYGVRQQVDRALAALEESRARVESLSRTVDASEEVVKIEKLMLDAGSGTQTDFLDSEAGLVVAHASLADARHREIMAHVELARITGELNREWISYHLENRP